MPYFLTGNFSFTESFFESTSGLTTTGATVMNPDILPKIFLFYRSMTAYLGGVGMILIMTSLFATNFGMRLFTAEGHQNNLIPNVIKSARMIVCIYTGYIIMGVIMYVIFGMPLFDAVNHSISAVANCGFSTHSESIGFYNSLPIEVITMVLSILGGTNFLLNLIVIKGNFKAYFKHCETKTMLVLWIIFVPILASILLGTICTTVGTSFRFAFFHIVAAMTTSGFQIVPTITTWPVAALVVLTLFMIVGFQSGSTAGGMKQYRIAIACKSIYYDVKARLKKKREIMPRKINIYGEEKELTDERAFEEHNFALLYLSLIFIGTLIYTLEGHPLEFALFDFSSMLGCAGLTTGVVGAGASDLSNWVGIAAMIIGRLDIYPLILAALVLGQDTKNTFKNLVVKGKKKNV
jgi:trk system potassium uptake protein TrkH